MITLTDFLVRSGFLFSANAVGGEVTYQLSDGRTIRNILEKNGHNLLIKKNTI